MATRCQSQELGQIGAWIVDALPILNCLPSPLAPWKKTAERWYQNCADVAMTNLQDALNRPGWNWSKDFSNSKEVKHMSAVEVSWDLNILCDAVVETTAVMLQVFTLASLAFPEWVSTAQSEIDAVVSEERLPTSHDLNEGKLPYLYAVIEEIFR